MFEAALRLLSPFMPFLTEELWHALYGAIEQPVPAKSIALTRFPLAEDFAEDRESVAAMQSVAGVDRDGARVAQGAWRAGEGAGAGSAACVQRPIGELARTNADMLERLARIRAVEIAPEALSGNSARSTAQFDVAVVYERQIDVAAERERLTRELAKYDKGLQAAEKQLGNPGLRREGSAAHHRRIEEAGRGDRRAEEEGAGRARLASTQEKRATTACAVSERLTRRRFSMAVQKTPAYELRAERELGRDGP